MARFAWGATILLAAALASVPGCIAMPGKAPSNPGAADPRAENEKIVILEDQLAAAKADRNRLARQLDAARKSPDAAKGFAFEVTRIEFGFLTAAVSFDNSAKVTDRKYDNGIAAYVNLLDQFDSSLKAAGDFRFDLFDLSRDRNFVIASWSFDAEAAAKYWQRFPGGYQFKLPLPSDLASRKVVLKATFLQPGRSELAATKELTLSRP